MEEKRARRRRDLERMKARARRVFTKYPNLWIGVPPIERDDPKRHEKLANHLAHCSRSCCGNPRRHPWGTNEEKLTMQERRRFVCMEEDDGEG